MNNNNLTIKSNKFDENKAEFGNIYLYSNNIINLNENNSFSHSYCISGCIILIFFNNFLGIFYLEDNN